MKCVLSMSGVLLVVFCVLFPVCVASEVQSRHISQKSAKLDDKRSVYLNAKKMKIAGIAAATSRATSRQVEPAKSSQGRYGYTGLSDGTSSVLQDKRGSQYDSRTLGLTSSSDNNFQLGLQFTVPFLSVPVRSLLLGSSDLLTQLQENWPTLLALAVLAVGTTLLVPWLVTQVSRHSATSPPGYINLDSGRARAQDDEGVVSLLMDRLDTSLHRYNINSTQCLQRVVCSQVQRAASQVQQGDANSLDLLLTGLASNGYVGSWMEGSAVMRASNAARSGASCQQSFPRCPLTGNSVYRALATLIGS